MNQLQNRLYYVLLSSILLLCSCSTNSSTTETLTKREKLPQQLSGQQISLSEKALAAAGITCERVKDQTITLEINTTGELKADEDRVFHVNTLVPGRLIQDFVVLGNTIVQGHRMATVQNLDVTKVSGEYIHQKHENELELKHTETKLKLARKNLERLNLLFKEGIASQKDLIQTQAEVELQESSLAVYREHTAHIKEESRALLNAYGVNIDDLKNETPASSSPVIAPRTGVVIKKNVTVGDIVSPSDPLYVLADLHQLWLDINIYDKDLSLVKEGEIVTFISDSIPNKRFSGRISYIKPLAGENKTFVARAVLPNPDHILKPGMFGQVKVVQSSHQQKPVISASAIEEINGLHFVFVRLPNQKYECRKVEADKRVSQGYLINSGIARGEAVATTGTFYLKTQILKQQASE